MRVCERLAGGCIQLQRHSNVPAMCVQSRLPMNDVNHFFLFLFIADPYVGLYEFFSDMSVRCARHTQMCIKYCGFSPPSSSSSAAVGRPRCALMHYFIY